MINYCSNKTSPVVVIDDNKTPMLINDVEDFTKKITAMYDTASRKYLMEFKKIKSKRSVEEFTWGLNKKGLQKQLKKASRIFVSRCL